jgi:uracil-DNA glycosylase family 4
MKNDLSELNRQVELCRKCGLWKTRSKAVFGEGPENANIMLVGLGPGYHENSEGRPFVGAAGKLLNELLALAGLEREGVYVTNIMKCYLPNNQPTEEEIKACTPYLDEQVEIIKPKTIILLGNVVNKYIFNKFGLQLSSMGNLHGKNFSASTLFLQVKIIPMYHPAAALRNPGLKDIVENDWRNLAKVSW